MSISQWVGHNLPFTALEKNIIRMRLRAQLLRAVSEVSSEASEISRYVPNGMFLAKDLGNLLGEKNSINDHECSAWHDVVLVTRNYCDEDASEWAQNNCGQRGVLAHRAVLSARCERFRAMFHFSSLQKRRDGPKDPVPHNNASELESSGSSMSPLREELRVSGMSCAALEVLVHYLYTASLPEYLTSSQAINFNSKEPEDASEKASNSAHLLMELLFVADEFLLPQLRQDVAMALALEHHISAGVRGRDLSCNISQCPVCIDALRVAKLLGIESLRQVAARFILRNIKQILKMMQRIEVDTASSPKDTNSVNESFDSSRNVQDEGIGAFSSSSIVALALEVGT
jgi:hypothetical protein